MARRELSVTLNRTGSSHVFCTLQIPSTKYRTLCLTAFLSCDDFSHGFDVSDDHLHFPSSFLNDLVVLVLFSIDYALGNSVALLCFEAA